MTAMNLIGAEDNILATARPDGSSADFYVYTKDLRESTVNMVGSDGTAPVSYGYTDYGETTILGDEGFYNEVCYGAGIYDKTTGLYYLNARYYSPENGAFLTQDTYRGDRSRTATLNYYSYCAGNPVSYTDPSGHAWWGVVGAALGAYDGYKYAKKKKLKGWKKAAAIVGGAALGAVNPFKVVKAAKKVYKAAKYTKKARSAAKKVKAVKKAAKKPKVTKVKTKKYKKFSRPSSQKKIIKKSNKNNKSIETQTKKKLKRKEVKTYAQKATKGPEESQFVVLGRYEANSANSYDSFAKEIRAQYFHLEDYDSLAKSYNRKEIWKINKQFINNQIKDGRTIVFSHNPNSATRGSYFEAEVNYLKEKGYSFLESGGKWYAK